MQHQLGAVRLLLLLLSSVATNSSASGASKTSYPPIGIGYMPTTLVINELVLDLDYKVIHEILSHKPIVNKNEKNDQDSVVVTTANRGGTLNHTTYQGDWTYHDPQDNTNAMEIEMKHVHDVMKGGAYSYPTARLTLNIVLDDAMDNDASNIPIGTKVIGLPHEKQKIKNGNGGNEDQIVTGVVVSKPTTILVDGDTDNENDDPRTIYIQYDPILESSSPSSSSSSKNNNYFTVVAWDEVLPLNCTVGLNPIKVYHKVGSCFEESILKNHKHDASSSHGKIQFIFGSTETSTVKIEYHYTYDIHTDTMNSNSIYELYYQLVAIQKNKKENDGNDKGSNYLDMIHEYYGMYEYPLMLLDNAFYSSSMLIGQDGDDNSGSNLIRGDINFDEIATTSTTSISTLRKEMILSSIPTLYFYTFVTQYLDQSLDNVCSSNSNSDNDEKKAINDWDIAVAYYTGSKSHGVDLSSGPGHHYHQDKGLLLFSLANSICKKFQTCGLNLDNEDYLGSDLDDSIATINYKIFSLFVQGQEKLLNNGGNDVACNEIAHIKDQIVTSIRVPIIQSLLYSAYKQSVQAEEQDDDEQKLTNRVKGTVMALSILPVLHKCNPDDAQIIYNEMVESMGDGSTTVDYQCIKQILESNYQCLQVSCNEIGGITTTTTNGGEPCTDDVNDDSWKQVYASKIYKNISNDDDDDEEEEEEVLVEEEEEEVEEEIDENDENDEDDVISKRSTNNTLHPHAMISLISIGALLKAVIVTLLIGWVARWYCVTRLRDQEDHRRSQIAFSNIQREHYDADMPIDDYGHGGGGYSDNPNRASSNIAAASILRRAMDVTTAADDEETTTIVAEIRRV